MKRFLSVLLILCLVFLLSACGDRISRRGTDTGSSTAQNQMGATDISSTEHSGNTSGSVTNNSGGCNESAVSSTNSTSSASSKPETSSTTSSGAADEQSVTKITLNEAKQIAENLVSKYHQYSYLTVCCDTVYNDDYTVCKIACCHSLKQMKEHTLKYLDKSIANEFTSEYFSDDKNGNIYVVIDGYGILGYGDISIIEYSSKKIVAKVPIVDIDGPTGACDVFYMVKKGNNFIITEIKR